MLEPHSGPKNKPCSIKIPAWTSELVSQISLVQEYSWCLKAARVQLAPRSALISPRIVFRGKDGCALSFPGSVRPPLHQHVLSEGLKSDEGQLAAI